MTPFSFNFDRSFASEQVSRSMLVGPPPLPRVRYVSLVVCVVHRHFALSTVMVHSVLGHNYLCMHAPSIEKKGVVSTTSLSLVAHTLAAKRSSLADQIGCQPTVGP